MRRVLIGLVGLSIAVAAVAPAAAQGGASLWNDCVAAEIQERLVAQQPVRLSADNVSLAGDVLRLTGNARVRFDRTTVVAEEIVIDQSSKRVQFTRVRQIELNGSRCSPPPRRLPRIEYR